MGEGGLKRVFEKRKAQETEAKHRQKSPLENVKYMLQNTDSQSWDLVAHSFGQEKGLKASRIRIGNVKELLLEENK